MNKLINILCARLNVLLTNNCNDNVICYYVDTIEPVVLGLFGGFDADVYYNEHDKQYS